MRSVGLFLLLTAQTIGYASTPKAYTIIEEKNDLKISTPSLASQRHLKIRLNNGLEAYIISDPDTKQSAAAIAVEVGSWNDPAEYPGMAHLCEHLLFMSSKKYPKENETLRFVLDNQGIFNAYTAPDRTVYMFTVNNNKVEEALDRYSRFFIDPSFNPNGVARELNAVDQEHAKNLEHDGWREWMIFKEMGNKNHPNHTFSTGNAETLGGIPQETLISWYEKHYKANRMHLVVYSATPLDELVEMVVDTFGDIRSGITSPLESQPLMSEDQIGHITYIEPIRELKKLSFTWEIPPAFVNDLQTAVPKLVAYALGNHREFSLFEQLRQEGLADDLEVDAELISKNQAFIRIEISLTTDGLKNLDTTIDRTFEAISALKRNGIGVSTFNELKRMSELNYEHQSRVEPFTFVQKHADALINEPLATYPKNTVAPTEYDTKKINRFISYLTPQNCAFCVIAPSELSGIKPDKQEKWMGARYAVKTVPYKKLSSLEKATGNWDIHFDQSNKYQPKKLTLISEIRKKDGLATPKLARDEPRGKLYWAQDQTYLVPKVAINLGYKSPLIDQSSRNLAMTDLLVYSASQELSPLFATGKRAGIYTQLKRDNDRIVLSLQGYSENANTYLISLVDELGKVMPPRERFLRYKESLLTEYENRAKSLPLVQGAEVLGSLVQMQRPTSLELKSCLEMVDYDDFAQYRNDMFARVYLEGSFTGNINEKWTLDTWDKIKKHTQGAIYPPSEHVARKVFLLPENKGPYSLKLQSELMGNAALLMVQIGEATPEKFAAHQILGKALDEPFFSTLRTKQQTGYIVKVWDREQENYLSYLFAVQSSTHQPDELIARFELFIEDYQKNYAENISQARFEELKTGLITSLSQPPQNLPEFSAKLDSEAFHYNGDFDRRASQIKALKKLSYEDFLLQMNAFLSRNNTKRIAIYVNGRETNKKAFKYEPMSADSLRLIGEYVSSTPENNNAR